MLSRLTVRETIMIAAELKLPPSTSLERKEVCCVRQLPQSLQIPVCDCPYVSSGLLLPAARVVL